jgi:hypothetical protein
VLLCVGITGFGLWWLVRDELPGSPVDPGTPKPASVALTADERDFYDYVGPRLRAVTAESEALVSLGKERSRNILELRRRGDRVNEIAAQIDTRVDTSGVPDRFTVAMDHYRTGIDAVRKAEAAARAALISFDWDAIARAVDVMDRGTQELQRARGELETLAGVNNGATPFTATMIGARVAAGTTS